MSPAPPRALCRASRSVRPFLLASAAACLLAGLGAAGADDFPPVTDIDRSVTSVSGEPNARAVVLFYRGDLKMPDPRKELPTSILTVNVREKILTPAGVEEGTVRIVHSAFTRLHDFEGRTIRPDGTIVPLPRDAAFTTTASKARKRFVTSVAFPSVEVGAILDYHYKLYWDTFTYLEPWYFAGTVPFLFSEIVYHLPPTVDMKIWGFGPGFDRIKAEPGSDVLGRTFHASGRDLPSLPDEPYSFPAADFAPRIMLVPVRVRGNLGVPLLEDWRSTCELYRGTYKDALHDDSDTRKLARSQIASAEADPGAKAAKLFRWVRDNVQTDEGTDVAPAERVTVDQVLGRRHGTSAEKALLLLALLDAAKVPAHLVWACDRGEGTIDPNVPTPAWFSRVLVAAETGNGRVLLDPTDATAAAGHIPPGFEGMHALLYDTKKPEVITLPEAPFAENRRAARVDLAVAENGSVEGHGTLTLTGHRGWEKVGWKTSHELAVAAWNGWLAERMKSFTVSDVKVTESVEESRVEVEWRLDSTEQGGGETEALVNPAAPLGPIALASMFPASGRQTPVLFDYGDRDDVELHLSWPPGWELEAPPSARSSQNGAGAFATASKLDAAARSLVATRRLDVAHKIFGNVADYDALRQLLLEAQRNDAQTIVVRRR